MELFKATTDFAGRSVYSQSQNWCTPPQYVDAVKRVFGGEIDLDPCSNPDSVVGAVREFRLPDEDGLAQEWNFRTIYVNPPYGADRSRGTTIRDWLAKCAATRKNYGAQIIALVPVATNTSHWKKHVFGVADAVCFLYDTRLRFLVNGNTDNKGAPMACAMVYWGDDFAGFETVFERFGAVVSLTSLKKQHKEEPSENLLFDFHGGMEMFPQTGERHGLNVLISVPERNSFAASVRGLKKEPSIFQPSNSQTLKL